MQYANGNDGCKGQVQRPDDSKRHVVLSATKRSKVHILLSPLLLAACGGNSNSEKSELDIKTEGNDQTSQDVVDDIEAIFVTEGNDQTSQDVIDDIEAIFVTEGNDQTSQDVIDDIEAIIVTEGNGQTSQDVVDDIEAIFVTEGQVSHTLNDYAGRSPDLEIFSGNIPQQFNLSKVQNTSDFISFKNFNPALDTLLLRDLNGDQEFTSVNFQSIDSLNENADLVVFSSTEELNSLITSKSNDYGAKYFLDAEVGVLYYTEVNADNASITKISELGVKIADVNEGHEGSLTITIDDEDSNEENLKSGELSTTGYFSNSYTLTIADIPETFLPIGRQLLASGIEVIDNLSEYIQWHGTLDFVIQFDQRDSFGLGNWSVADDGAGMPSAPFLGQDGYLAAHYEALFGIDINGTQHDLGTYLLPDSNGKLTNYGQPIYINAGQTPSDDNQVPNGYHDFFSILTHEFMHTLGIMAFEWNTVINEHIEVINEEQFYIGSNAVNLVGDVIPFETGHFGALPDGQSGGLMHTIGYYEGARWEIGQFELAVLTDLGYTVNIPEQLVVSDLDHVPIA